MPGPAPDNPSRSSANEWSSRSAHRLPATDLGAGPLRASHPRQFRHCRRGPLLGLRPVAISSTKGHRRCWRTGVPAVVPLRNIGRLRRTDWGRARDRPIVVLRTVLSISGRGDLIARSTSRTGRLDSQQQKRDGLPPPRHVIHQWRYPFSVPTHDRVQWKSSAVIFVPSFHCLVYNITMIASTR